jgi:diguanylate cyclase (GGDEF)-like protein
LIARITENLAYDPLSRRERFVAGFVSCVFLLAIAIDVPYATKQLPVFPWVLPTVQNVSFFALALTSWMLMSQYRVSRYAPIAILGCAFALAATYRVAIFLLDPTTFGGALVGGNLRSISVLRFLTRIAFDAIIAFYAYTDWRERREPGSGRSLVVPVWIGAFTVLVFCLLAVTICRESMPTLIDAHNHYTLLYERVVAPITLLCGALTAVLVVLLADRQSRLRLWLFVDLVAMSANTIVRALGSTIFSNGFYLSCGFEIIESTLFVFVAQAQVAQMLHRSERTSARAHALSETLALADAQSYGGIDALLTRVVQELDFDFAALFRISRGELEADFAVGTNGFKRGERIALEGSVTRLALSTKEIVVVEDFRESQWSGHRVNDKELWSSACVLPVFSEGGEYGSIAFANTKTRRKRLTALDQEYLRVVGVMIGNALERIRQKRRLDELAYYDALTSLPNRVLLIDRITAALSLAERTGNKLAVYFIDLDQFKPVNDGFGHAVGDDVLRGVAKRLEQTIRASDTVARYGGDEFVVLQPVLEDMSGIDELRMRIAQAMRMPIEVPAGSFSVGASIGFSIFPDDGRDAFTLVLRADEAQYRVKDARRAARANISYDSGS